MKRPPRILISHVYSSNNNGDAAILSAQISELKRVFPGAEITMATMDGVPEGYRFDGLPVARALMYGAVAPGRNKLIKLLFSAAMLLYTTLWAVLRRMIGMRLPLPKAWRKPMSILDTADVQVCVGGGYLRAKPDLTSTIILTLLVHQIWLARILGKPVYLYAQSFGPYPTKLQTRIAKSGIKAATLVLVREAKSYRQLQALGIATERIARVPDSAFLFTAPLDKAVANEVRPSGSHDVTVVGITVRSWLDEKRQADFESAIAELIRHIARKPGYRVVIIPQVTSTDQGDDDRVSGGRIAALLESQENVTFLDRRFSHEEILSAYASLDYLVGTRFHSVIFSLLSYVPAVAIEYEHKTSGIMQDLGLAQWVIPMDLVTAEGIIERFDALVKNDAAYRAQLKKVIPEYVAAARHAADRIAQDYQQRP